MIDQETAIEADQVFKWCSDLQQSEAFERIVLAEITERREAHLREGTNVNHPAAERAEHHRAFHLADELSRLVEKRKSEAANILEQWKAQNGETAVLLADHSNL